jgi:hypothetical protein
MTGLLIFPHLTNKYLLFIPIIGLGIAWASTVTFGAIFKNLLGDKPEQRHHLRRDPARLRRGGDNVDQGAADRPGRRRRARDARWAGATDRGAPSRGPSELSRSG